eukprot:TRINITY_DN2624_c0_g1_i1.p1 TRINITY_DN2624_c0_g1~~TRINITY_DN2624_c0_g1_i1.p1  ORF type:complete len:329 (-),score=119.93 TRINITY_DN2624_c0_g1_i1:423-1352(-)
MAATTLFAKNVIQNISKLGSTYLLPYVDPIEQQVRAFLKVQQPTLLSDYDAAMKTGDQLSKNFPLMNPFHVVLIILAYFVVVFGGKFLMSFKKDPFQPKLLQIVHNALLVAVSAFMTYETVLQAVSNNFSLFQNAVDHKHAALARIIWIFYFSKILEFTDTFIMVLKKSDRQISFLHIYHHTTIFAIWWAVTKWGPGGEAYFSVILNSFVHVVMYSYYLSTTVGFPLSFIKPYITSMQMFQFVLMMVQSGYDLAVGCPGYPRPLIALLFGYMITLLALFANFFIKDRARAARERRAAKGAAAATKPKKA